MTLRSSPIILTYGVFYSNSFHWRSVHGNVLNRNVSERTLSFVLYRTEINMAFP